MSESKSQTQGAVVDFGTSPHGLSAELQRPHQEARPAESSDSLADAFDLSANTVPRSCAAGEPEVFSLTEEQRCHLAYAALCQIDALEESDEAEEPEVLEGIRLLNEARAILRQGRHW